MSSKIFIFAFLCLTVLAQIKAATKIAPLGDVVLKPEILTPSDPV